MQGIKHILWNTSASWSVFPKNPNGLPRTWISASRSNKQSPSGSVFLCQTWLLMTTLCKLGDCFLFIFKSSEILRCLLPRNAVVDIAVVKMRTSSNKSNCIMWDLYGFVPVCMNEGIITVLCQRQLRSNGNSKSQLFTIPYGSWVETMLPM